VPGTTGTNTIRGGGADAVMIGLSVKKDDGRSLLEGGFDGFYTYFATDGFTYGSTASHWSELAEWARTHDKLFVPCVAHHIEIDRVPNSLGAERKRFYGKAHHRA
jgi:hypothetical protein